VNCSTCNHPEHEPGNCKQCGCGESEVIEVAKSDAVHGHNVGRRAPSLAPESRVECDRCGFVAYPKSGLDTQELAEEHRGWILDDKQKLCPDCARGELFKKEDSR